VLNNLVSGVIRELSSDNNTEYPHQTTCPHKNVDTFDILHHKFEYKCRDCGKRIKYYNQYDDTFHFYKTQFRDQCIHGRHLAHGEFNRICEDCGKVF
jgi:hypothetical protein